ncbi:MAG: putative copper-binding protein [Actinomycetia bacterium]|nr:putative copper-binding protein [Actinomycetes bacterium]
MTTTETPEAPQPPAAPEDNATRREEFKTRFVLPLLLPIGSALLLLVLVLSISKLFLAGGKSSWVTATIITLMILGGAACLSAARRMRSSSMTVLVGIVVVLTLLSGMVVLGASGEEKVGTGFVAPAGPAVQTLKVEALPSIKFDKTQYDLGKAGVTEVDYGDGGGSHTLVFAGIDGFELAVPGGPTKGKIDLKAGTYTIYCTVPGHRAQGMEAKVVVK